MRSRQIAMAGPPFVAPGGPVVPLAASALIVGLLWTLAWRELLAAAVVAGISAVVYAVIERRKATAKTVAHIT